MNRYAFFALAAMLGLGGCGLSQIPLASAHVDQDSADVSMPEEAQDAVPVPNLGPDTLGERKNARYY